MWPFECGEMSTFRAIVPVLQSLGDAYKDKLGIERVQACTS